MTLRNPSKVPRKPTVGHNFGPANPRIYDPRLPRSFQWAGKGVEGNEPHLDFKISLYSYSNTIINVRPTIASNGKIKFKTEIQQSTVKLILKIILYLN